MKNIVIYGLIVCTIILVIVLALLYSNPTVAVLGYHDFGKDVDDSNTFVLNIGKFDEQLKYLKNSNFR